jgi:hypothetical protein
MEVIERKDAKEQGLKFYFTGKPCKNGHFCERYVSTRKCVTCQRLQNQANNKIYYEANKEELRAKQQKYYASYYEYNKEAVLAKNKRCYKNNKEYYFATARRWAIQKLKAVPIWFDRVSVDEIYLKRKLLTDSTGVKHDVDHIVPLRSPYVCGLHWHGNLVLLTATENRSKGNRCWPDMPDLSDPELRGMVEAFKEDSIT